ncbi:hypothetical protein [Winogradskyella forsetii]|uniref:hypothetical protein n=1 Tax=Winogradskyella forsetii TaxID=2686077 RepID=UPI0015C1A902|nr:hypothetical protein [Winogradskyella forsetii]
MSSTFYKTSQNDIHIHIFKTNIETMLDLDMLQLFFNANRNIIEWSVDLEDIDKVLRVDSRKNLSQIDIINQVKLMGFSCEELD